MDRDLRAKLDAELKALTDEVDAAIAKRTQWMNDHMKDYAAYQVGEELYDLNSGVRLGVVTELYRYHSGDPRYDTSMSIDYRYKLPGPDNFIDNTSRHGGALYFGSKAEYLELMRSRLKAMGG